MGLTLMKDFGEYTYNKWDAPRPNMEGETEYHKGACGAIVDIAVLARAIDNVFGRLLSVAPLKDEVDPDEPEPRDLTEFAGIPSNSCPTKLQLQTVRRLAQQSSSLLRDVVSEERDAPVHTVGNMAQRIIPQQYSGQDQFDKHLRSEKRQVHATKVDNLVKALQAPMPFRFKEQAYRPGWVWEYSPDIGEL